MRIIQHTVNESAAHSALDFGHLTEEARCRVLRAANEHQTRLYEERLQAAGQKGLVDGGRRGLCSAARVGLSVDKAADEVESAVFALQ